MNVLKDSYSEDGLQDNTNREDNCMTTDILNFIRGTNKLRAQHFIKFLLKELANTKILSNRDEGCQMILGNIEDELIDRLIPAMS